MELTTKDSLVDRFGTKLLIDLTDRSDPRAGAINDDVLDAAIETASHSRHRRGSRSA